MIKTYTVVKLQSGGKQKLVAILNALFNKREEPYPFLDQPIVFDTHTITIGEAVFNLSQLGQLTLEMGSYDGMVLGSRKKMELNGTGNYLSFVSGEYEHCYEFYIDSAPQFNNFKALFESWYINKVAFSEYDRGRTRTFLLEPYDYLAVLAFEKKHHLL